MLRCRGEIASLTTPTTVSSGPQGLQAPDGERFFSLMGC